MSGSQAEMANGAKLKYQVQSPPELLRNSNPMCFSLFAFFHTLPVNVGHPIIKGPNNPTCFEQKLCFGMMKENNDRMQKTAIGNRLVRKFLENERVR